jgi:hypothetical protein
MVSKYDQIHKVTPINTHTFLCIYLSDAASVGKELWSHFPSTPLIRGREAETAGMVRSPVDVGRHTLATVFSSAHKNKHARKQAFSIFRLSPILSQNLKIVKMLCNILNAPCPHTRTFISQNHMAHLEFKYVLFPSPEKARTEENHRICNRR